MKYISTAIENISHQQFVSLICQELNEAGYKIKRIAGGESVYEEYEAHEDIVIVDVIKDTTALKYLKDIGLLDNGKCPQCGNLMNNKYTFTSGFSPYGSYYICKNCFDKGKSMQGGSKGQKGNSGCLLFVLIFIISSFYLLLSCNDINKTSNNTVFKKDLSAKITKDENSNSLPEGYHWGQAKPYVGKDIIEKNIIRESSNYYKALLNGDIKRASNYIYPDVITYNKKYHPNDYIGDDIINEAIKFLSDHLIKLNKGYSDYGMEIDFIVCKIDKIIEAHEAILCAFGITTQVYYDKYKGEKYFHSTLSYEDYQIGVSLNNGNDWYFMTLHENVSNILQLRFSKDIISQIINIK
jgi:hypothetical protein